MKYSVRFQLEKRSKILNGVSQVDTRNIPVLLSVTWSLKQIKFYTGKRCNLSQWDPVKGELKGNVSIASNGEERNLFNSYLNNLKRIVDELFKSYDNSNIIPDSKQFLSDLKFNSDKNEISIGLPKRNSFFDNFNKYAQDAPICTNRKLHVKNVSKKVLQFNPDTTFENIDFQYLTDFRKYLSQKVSRNTVIANLKMLRAFYGYAIKMGWTTNYPFKLFTIDSEAYGDPFFITINERDKLYDAFIQNKQLSQVRDAFILQCNIGCRYGDFITLKHSNIIDGCIEYIAGKTKENKPRVARVPLTTKAKAIIARYNLPNGDLLPYIPQYQYNKYLKNLFKDQLLTRMVTILDPKTRKSIQKPISEVASSHMARRVFIGGLYHAGVKNEIIASMSGHVVNSNAFYRYYSIEKSEQQSAISLIE